MRHRYGQKWHLERLVERIWHLGGVPVPIHIAPLQTGVFLTGEASEEPSKQPVFNAEAFPTGAIGGQNPGGGHVFTTAGGAITCSGVSLAVAELSKATASVQVQPSYEKCAWKGIAGTKVSLNGCSYTVGALNVGPPYSGSVGISCSGGNVIEITAQIAGVTKCKYYVGGQSGLGGVGFENTGSGYQRAIVASLNLSGISYLQAEGVGAGKCSSGVFSTGTFTGASTFTGLRN